MAKVIIGIPCMDSVSTSFFSSILGQEYTAGDLYSYGIEVGSMVYTARGRIANSAINRSADVLVFYDSDMILEPDTTTKLVNHIVKGGKDFVSGIYFKRNPNTEPLILKELDWYSGDDMIYGPQETAIIYEDYPKDTVFEIAGCGFGVCAMSVEMLKQVTVASKMNPFTPLPRLSEDYSFCFRARQAGYKLWCDSTIKTGHAGLKVYTEADWERLKEARKQNG